MITTIQRAITWEVSRILRVPEEMPVAHQELEHAHWDRTRREWFTHVDHSEGAAVRAA
jgi:hypothetical protein